MYYSPLTQRTQTKHVVGSKSLNDAIKWGFGDLCVTKLQERAVTPAGTFLLFLRGFHFGTLVSVLAWKTEMEWTGILVHQYLWCFCCVVLFTKHKNALKSITNLNTNKYVALDCFN